MKVVFVRVLFNHFRPDALSGGTGPYMYYRLVRGAGCRFAVRFPEAVGGSPGKVLEGGADSDKIILSTGFLMDAGVFYSKLVCNFGSSS